MLLLHSTIPKIMRRIIAISSFFLVLAIAIYEQPTSYAQQPKSKGTKGKTVAAAGAFGNSDAITEEELKIYDYFLASDQLEGRNLPSRGYDTAALYVASHLAEWGIKPAGSTTGTNGPLQAYFMPFELVANQVIAEESKASVTGPAERGGRGGAGGGGGRGAAGGSGPRTTNFEYGKDWMVMGGGRGGAAPLETFEVAGNLVFAGNGYVIHKPNVNPFDGLNVKGKIVVVAGLPAEIAAQQNAPRGGGGAPNPLGENCTDFLTPEEAAAKNGAVAVVKVATFQQLTTMSNPNPAAPTGFGLAAPIAGSPTRSNRPA